MAHATDKGTVIIDKLIELTTIGIQISSDGRLVYANDVLAAIFDYSSPSEMMGRNIESLYSKDQSANIEATHAYSMTSGTTSTLSTAVGIRKDGSFFNVLWINSMMKYHDRPALLTLVVDLSLEENVSDRLPRPGATRSLSLLARGIAHEINNIIGIISGSIDLMSTSTPRLPFNNVLIEQASAACKRGKELARQLFRLAPRSSGAPPSVSVNSIVNNALQTLNPMIPESITLSRTSDIPPGEDFIRANPTHILEMLIDLCRSAINAMQEKGGIIRIDVCNVFLDSRFCVNLDFPMKPGHYLRLSVAHTGAGIDPSLIPHMFDPFFTAEDFSEGCGLELAIAQATMRSADGAITVESLPGGETTFNLFFPRPESMPSTLPIETGPQPSAGFVVLLIQDDPELAGWGADVLEDLGCVVTRKSSIADALDLMQDPAISIDIILVEGSMLQTEPIHSIPGFRIFRPTVPLILWGSNPGAEFEGSNTVHGLRKPTTGKDIELLVHRVLNIPSNNR